MAIIRIKSHLRIISSVNPHSLIRKEVCLLSKPKKSKVIVIGRDLINSKAFLSLKGVSPQLLMLFLARRRLEKHGRRGKKKWVCVNASEIIFTYSEAKRRFGISNARFTRGIDDLIAKGFIDIVHPGGCYKHEKSVYGISDRWRLFGGPGFVCIQRPKDPVQRGYRKMNCRKVTNECGGKDTVKTDVVRTDMPSVSGAGLNTGTL